MPGRNEDLHGNAPDRSAVALIIIDMINDLEFEGGDRLLDPAVRAAERIAELKRRARAAGIPVIYANDNFGRWRSDFREVIDHVLRDGVRGRPLTELLRPEDEDYFVLKPKHSAFFSTTLETLLEYLGTQRIVITGIATDNCVLFTANDAYLRDLEISVPPDCTASIREAWHAEALEHMKRVLKADVRESVELDLEGLA